MGEDDLHIETALREVDQAEDRRAHYELADVFERAAAAYQALGEAQRARQLRWELEAWRLVPNHAWESDIAESNFMPMVTFSDGSVWPDLAAFSQEQLDYLRGRSETTQNPALRALYRELLWDRERDPASAREAAAAYSEVARLHADEETSIDLMHAITRPLTLALQLNDGTLLAQARQLIRDWIGRFGIRHEALRLIELAQALLQRASRIDQADLELAADALEAAAAEAGAIDNWPVERAALDALIQLRNRLGTDQDSTNDLRERIARSYVREAEAHEAESPQLASHSWLSRTCGDRGVGATEVALAGAALRPRGASVCAAGRAWPGRSPGA